MRIKLLLVFLIWVLGVQDVHLARAQTHIFSAKDNLSNVTASESLEPLSFSGLPESFQFSGQIDFDRKELKLVLNLPPPKPSPVEEPPKKVDAVIVQINQVNGNAYKMSLKIDHLKTFSYDISTEVETSLDMEGMQNGLRGFISGKLQSLYTTIDLKPIHQLAAEFSIKNNKLTVQSLVFGNVILNGTVDMVAPYKIDLLVNLNAIDMPDFLDFWDHGNLYQSSGSVFGTIKVSGTVDKLFLKGNLESLKGHVEDLTFDRFLLNAEGYFPNMQIAKSSKVSQPDGTVYTLDGSIDLSDKDKFKEQIESLNISPIVDGSSGDRAWTIKRLQNETSSSSTEIKYLLHKDASQPSAEAPSDILGVQRTMEF
jgi:hypothetical protein